MRGFKTFLAEHVGREWPTLAPASSVSDIDQRIVQLYTSGAKIREIEEQSGKWRSYIYGVLQREGVRPARLNQTRELAIQLAGSGVPVSKIAEITCQTARNVREILAKYRGQTLRHE